MCIVGAGLTSLYSIQRDVRMEPGDQAIVAGYQFEFNGISLVQGPNYIADQALIVVTKNDHFVEKLRPEKRRYMASGQTMTEAAIGGGLMRDLYVALGEPLKGDAWAIRVYVKPFVRWIWLGGLLIAAGGLLAVLDKRYRRSTVVNT